MAKSEQVADVGKLSGHDPLNKGEWHHVQRLTAVTALDAHAMTHARHRGGQFMTTNIFMVNNIVHCCYNPFVKVR